MHSPICRLGVRAGTGNSVVLRGLSIAGKRENSNGTVKTNGPNFFVQHPLTEIQRKTDRTPLVGLDPRPVKVYPWPP